ncbi:MAG TPA: hypothetical protein VGI78_19265 [Acetobacteraceae bacterium]
MARLLQLEHIALGERADRITQQLVTLQSEHQLLKGSLRTFLRGYLPVLRRHLLGQRP